VEAARYYMACLDLTGRSVLVVGAGPVGLEKAEGLLAAGAAVTVVSPEALPAFDELDVELVRRAYRTDDLDGKFLVVAATNVNEVNRGVYRDAEARSMLCNVADVPELCSFILPAVHRHEPIAIAVSTGGASPALAQHLRDQIATVVRPEHAELAHRLRDLRPWAKSHFATYEERKAYFAGVVAQELG
jgi:precorrin-2 dehydrogenase / sirohydrochlorin ferrochelatase